VHLPELDASVMASAARIPFRRRLHRLYRGRTAGGRQYKIATYLGGKAHAWGDGILDLGQGAAAF
jgi:hypothetical protein